jgi:RimJ/RimL family protein N-acetyltransferase
MAGTLRSRAQRRHVKYLFPTRTSYRIWAATEVQNIAEQRVVERSGFSQEGQLRVTHFRDGKWRDRTIQG